MGTKRQYKYPYMVHYTDGSYMIYDLTKPEFQKLSEAVTYNLATVSIEDVGLLTTKDIRSVIKQKPQPKPKKTENGLPELSPEELEWMQMNKAAWSTEAEEDFTQ
jgi:hypothetical protein